MRQLTAYVNYFLAESIREFAPILSFASQSPVVAVLGRNVTLRCFFAAL
jgi:hypothetical protein